MKNLRLLTEAKHDEQTNRNFTNVLIFHKKTSWKKISGNFSCQTCSTPELKYCGNWERQDPIVK